MVQPGVSALGKKNSTTGLPRNCFSETGFPFSSGKVNSGALSLTCMGNSPYRSTLYRTGRRLVICSGLLLLAAAACAQFARKNAVSKGPRATALLVLPAKGKAHLVPIAIMVDGRFYDAGAYKADPVPMALEPGTVYEAERTGESLGLFTINEDLQQQKTNTWIAEGTYHANGEQVASTSHKAENRPREEKDEGPPVLRRPGSTSSNSPAPSSGSKPPAPTPDSRPANTPAEAKPTTAPAKSDNTTASSAPAPKLEPSPEDPNVPKLRRGKPENPSRQSEPEPVPTPVKKPASNAAPDGSVAHNIAGSPPQADVQLIPAISDADGPEAHPYKYEMSPAEEEGFRLKMLAMAGDELGKQSKAFETTPPASTAASAGARQRRGAKSSSKRPPPTFEDVQLRVFDVSASNEPVIVLTATAHPPQSGKEETKIADYYITLVTRSDIYGELRKLLSVVSDSEHLDVSPRLQLIDAVDADGDGRGELLFRQISDAGSAYVIYRVHPDQLWSLFEGTPQ